MVLVADAVQQIRLKIVGWVVYDYESQRHVGYTNLDNFYNYVYSCYSVAGLAK